MTGEINNHEFAVHLTQYQVRCRWATPLAFLNSFIRQMWRTLQSNLERTTTNVDVPGTKKEEDELQTGSSCFTSLKKMMTTQSFPSLGVQTRFPFDLGAPRQNQGAARRAGVDE